MTAWLDDEEEAARSTVANPAALWAGHELAARGVGEGLDHVWLQGAMVGNDVVAERAIAVHPRRQLARRLERQRLPDLRISRQLAARSGRAIKDLIEW